MSERNWERVMCIVFTTVMGFTVSQAVAAQAPASPDTLALTVEDALRIALTEGNTVRIADQEVIKKKYDRKSAIAKLFPSVDATGNYNYTIQKQVMYLGNMKMPGMPEGGQSKGIEVGRTYQVTGGVSAALPVLNTQIWGAIALSREAVELALLQAEESRINLYNQVVKTYYGILLAKESEQVIRSSYENARTNYEQIKGKFDVGLVAEFNLLRADVSVKSLEPQVQAARDNVEASLNQLKILLSLSIDQPISCTEKLSEMEGPMYREYFAGEGLPQGNSQLKQLDKQVDMLMTQEKMAKWTFLPSLNVVGFYRYNAMDDAFSWRDYNWIPFSAIQVTLTIPLFRGFDRIQAVKKAQVSRAQVELQREQLRSSVRAEADRYRNNIRTAVKKYVSAKEAVRQAEKGYKIAKVRYDLGSSTLVELNDANLALAQSRLNYYQALYDYIANDADLKRVRGDLPPLSLAKDDK